MEAGGVDSALQAFEQTCIEFEVPATRARAEAALLDFRQQQNPVPACQHILERSHYLQARFQAVLTLRDAALRNWGLMGHEAQVRLRSYILHYILRHAKDAGLILAQLTGALVALLKRGWKDATAAERQTFFAELEAAVRDAGAPPARRAALQILSATVTEFSPATASPLGQSWEFHEQCRASLEADFLRTFFVHAVAVAREAAPSAADGGDSGVCAACIQLLTAILSWEFRQASAPRVVYGAGRPTGDSLQVKPGPGWRDLLLAPEAVEWLVQLLGSLRGQFTPLAADARNLVVTLCSVSGDIFSSPVAAQRQLLGLQAVDEDQVQYLRRLLVPILQWVSPPQSALQQADTVDEAELLDACRAIAAAAPIHGASGFEYAVPAGEGSGGALGVLCAVTEACVSMGGTSEEAEGSWLAQATELLLDAWVGLLMEDCAGDASQVSQTVAAASGRIFSKITEAALKESAAGAFEDEAEGEAAEVGTSGDGSSKDQVLARSALLARAAAADAMLLTARLIQERLSSLQQCLTSATDPSIPLEELCWLVRMGAHIAADSGEGETPLPPLAVATAAAAACRAGRPDPLEALSHSLLAVAGLCLDDTLKHGASPRLMEAAVWAVARWADTYLLPIAPVSPAMGRAFGGDPHNGPNVLQVLTLVAVTLLGGPEWAGEVDLHRVAILKLLTALVRRRTVCTRLVQVDAWQQLAGAFAAQGGAVQQLAGPLQRSLAKVLCQAAVGLPDMAAVNSYIPHLMHNVVEEIKALAARPDLPSIAARPDVALRADGLVSILRGAAGGCGPRTQPPLWALVSAVVGPLTVLAEAFHADATITCLLLKLAGDVVEAHISYLPASDAGVLCDWVLQLLRRYSSHKQGRVSVAASQRLRQDAETETYRDLRALLRLLTHLTQRDLLDFHSPEAQANGHPVDVAQVVFLGLSILVPLMQIEQLKFPKLARAYFTLLSYMLEVYPERVAGLPESQIQQIMGTLRWGISTTDLDVALPSLEALAALARFHANAVAAGAHGVPSLSGAAQGPLGGFMEVILQRLLMEEDWRDVVDAAADCLLPLILAHQVAFQQLGEHLVATQAAPEQKETIGRALTQLLGSNGVTAALDRVNRRRLRSNLCVFVGTVRDVVRTR